MTRAAGISRALHYRRLHLDPEYGAAFADVRREVAYLLEDEAFRRACWA